jgi:hypothetical protein
LPPIDLNIVYAAVSIPLTALAIRLWARWAKDGGLARALGGVVVGALGLDGLRQLNGLLSGSPAGIEALGLVWGLVGGCLVWVFISAWQTLGPEPRLRMRSGGLSYNRRPGEATEAAPEDAAPAPAGDAAPVEDAAPTEDAAPAPAEDAGSEPTQPV